MLDTVITFPIAIEQAINDVLRTEITSEWLKRTEILHARYMDNDVRNSPYINDYTDAIAYLALRSSATYTQILGALSSVKDLLPTFTPTTLLDIGSGSGMGLWATHTIFPSVTSATCIEDNPHTIAIGRKIVDITQLPIDTTWKRENFVNERLNEGNKRYDIVLISSVLNELNYEQRVKLLTQAFSYCKGVLVVVEPGTPNGSRIIDSVFTHFATSTPLAPYLGKNLIANKDYWIHFPQRFKRPEFLRRVRKHMQENNALTSDFEETKYSYGVISKILPEIKPWGRCVGPVELQKGFLEVMILTQNELSKIKVMKRHKTQYDFAKRLRWGELILKKEDLVI